MILINKDIELMIKAGKIGIENFKPKNLGPVSYDLTIGDKVRYIDASNWKHNLPEEPMIDITKPVGFGRIEELPINLNHNDALVFTTEEVIYVCPSITGIVFARSSLTKLPILFNIPGLIDPGFRGSLTGVMYNFSGHPLKIKKMRICQVVFHQHQPVEKHYGTRELSKHQNQKDEKSLTARIDKEFLPLESKESTLCYVMYVDGAGNLFKGKKRGNSVIRTFDEFTGEKETIPIENSTNNEAELKAILYGIKKILKTHAKYAKIYSDSKLAVQGINMEIDIKAENLIPILNEIWDILLKDYDIIWIPNKKQKAHSK